MREALVEELAEKVELHLNDRKIPTTQFCDEMEAVAYALRENARCHRESARGDG